MYKLYTKIVKTLEITIQPRLKRLLSHILLLAAIVVGYDLFYFCFTTSCTTTATSPIPRCRKIFPCTCTTSSHSVAHSLQLLHCIQARHYASAIQVKIRLEMAGLDSGYRSRIIYCALFRQYRICRCGRVLRFTLQDSLARHDSLQHVAALSTKACKFLLSPSSYAEPL